MRKSAGFSLIELMIVVAVLGILVAIAYPSFLEQVRESRRSDGYAALMETAARQERFFTVENMYSSNIDEVGGSASAEGYYTISVVVSGAVVSGGGSTFTLSAAGNGTQANDVGCTPLTLSHAGVKAPAACW